MVSLLSPSMDALSAHKRWPQWMHNGEIAQFQTIRRKLHALLSDEIFNTVKGNTG